MAFGGSVGKVCLPDGYGRQEGTEVVEAQLFFDYKSCTPSRKKIFKGGL